MLSPLSLMKEVVSLSPDFFLKKIFFVTEFSEGYLGKTPIFPLPSVSRTCGTPGIVSSVTDC